MNTDDKIKTFLAAPAFAVVGASNNPAKFGNRIYALYLQLGRKVYPVNPHESKIMQNQAYKSLSELPEPVQSISIITPAPVTEKIVDDAIAAGIKNIWMQPGAESKLAVEKAQEAGINVIAGGPCLLELMESQ